jgi:hypothetical protein
LSYLFGGAFPALGGYLTSASQLSGKEGGRTFYLLNIKHIVAGLVRFCFTLVCSRENSLIVELSNGSLVMQWGRFGESVGVSAGIGVCARILFFFMSSLRTCPACVRVWSGIPALFGALLILLPMCSVRGRVHAEAPRFLLRGWWKGKAAPGAGRPWAHVYTNSSVSSEAFSIGGYASSTYRFPLLLVFW